VSKVLLALLWGCGLAVVTTIVVLAAGGGGRLVAIVNGAAAALLLVVARGPATGAERVDRVGGGRGHAVRPADPPWVEGEAAVRREAVRDWVANHGLRGEHASPAITLLLVAVPPAVVAGLGLAGAY
jgi:hypothetical protein